MLVERYQCVACAGVCAVDLLIGSCACMIIEIERMGNHACVMICCALNCTLGETRKSERVSSRGAGIAAQPRPHFYSVTFQFNHALLIRG